MIPTPSQEIQDDEEDWRELEFQDQVMTQSTRKAINATHTRDDELENLSAREISQEFDVSLDDYYQASSLESQLPASSSSVKKN